KPEEDWDRTD
uniref:Skin secreted peptide P1-4 n=1 Tax=Phasmahyla jandaia TaxID=762504 RepID=SSP14_PHAJA|nr:RecName: Full=Skin secreted peptide P1-4; Short=PjP1-4 [Phasmahyla jandaia]